MVGFFRAIWEWAGRVDTTRGRVGVLSYPAAALAAMAWVIWQFATDRFDRWGIIALTLAFAFAIIAVIGLARLAWARWPGKGPRFPRSEIAVKNRGYFDTDDDRLILFEVRVTNREPSRRFNLEMEFVLQMFVEATRTNVLKPFETRFFLAPQHDRLPDALPNPLDVGPESTRSGSYLFQTYKDDFLIFDEDLSGFAAKEGDRLLLRVRDHVTGATTEGEIPSVWEPK